MPNVKQIELGRPTRLTRPKPPIAFAATLGIICSALGAGLYWVCTTLLVAPPPPWAVTYLVSGLFFGIGVLLLVSVVLRLFVGFTPAPVVELSEQPFPRGRRIGITVIQPGPVDWRTFSMNLECLAETYKWGERLGDDSTNNRRGETFRTTLTSRVVEVHELLAAQPVQAPRGSDWRRTFECVLRDDSLTTLKNDDDAVFWQVVVKGSNSVLIAFEDKYEVCVE